MADIGKTSLKGIFHEEFQYSFLLKAGIVEADEGKAVSLDTSVANTVKLATDGDVIVGKLERVEDRSIAGTLLGTISLFGGMEFLTNPDVTAGVQTPVIGTYLEGAEDDTGTPVEGYVQGVAGPTKWLVVEIVSATKCIAIAT